MLKFDFKPLMQILAAFGMLFGGMAMAFLLCHAQALAAVFVVIEVVTVGIMLVVVVAAVIMEYLAR